MPIAEIITIGTEILLGEIVDTNAQFIARRLRDIGVDLYRKTTIGDNPQRIALAIQEALKRCQIIITTGGLGPTIDDPTREAVALALNSELEYHPELWEQICERFERFGRLPTENNKRQAFLPKGAEAMENPVGTAPAFFVEKDDKCIVCLPGVPREMMHLLEDRVFPYLCTRYHLQEIILTRILHTAGIGESQIDEHISDLELMDNPTVGLAAHSGQVDIRLTVKATSQEDAIAELDLLEKIIRQRLGDYIYGVDEDTLAEAALGTLQRNNFTLCVIECNFQGELIKTFNSMFQEAGDRGNSLICKGESLKGSFSDEEFWKICEELRLESHANLCLGTMLQSDNETQRITIALTFENGKHIIHRPYGGPPEYAFRWALNHALNTIRTLDRYINPSVV